MASSQPGRLTADVRNGGASRARPSLIHNLTPCPVPAPDGVVQVTLQVLWSHDAGALAPCAAPGAAAPLEPCVWRLHVFGAQWDVAAEGYETVAFGPGGQAVAALRFAWERAQAWLARPSGAASRCATLMRKDG